MAQIIDSMGREYAALIAARTLIVQDPMTGIGRKVFAGKPVPAGLEDSYRLAIGDPEEPNGDDNGDGDEEPAEEEPVETPAPAAKRTRRKKAAA